MKEWIATYTEDKGATYQDEKVEGKSFTDAMLNASLKLSKLSEKAEIVDVKEIEKMNEKVRCEMVRAMETVARAVNDEEVFEGWLMCGVADGDIDDTTTDEELEYYIEDKHFAELMDTFLRVMSRAEKSGGLYVDGVVSK